MCHDVAPEHVKSYLEMLDRTDELVDEVSEAISIGHGNLTGLREVAEFLDDRRLVLEAMAGYLDDTYILVTPFAGLLRGQ